MLDGVLANLWHFLQDLRELVDDVMRFLVGLS